MTDTLTRLTAALADRYTIQEEVGEGGMATVYLAEDLKHKRQVAVKVLKPELAAVLGAERFIQEIRTTANLQHPHILPLFDSGEADGFLYYVMPYIDGETLRDKLSRETQLGIDEAVKITTEVADALDYAHRQDVIHRDIKPENILLHDGRPMVADFGIALAVSAAAGGRMTETGMSLGTPHYMSPEQATAEKDISSRSDVYSLAAVLYEMLTGEPPHTGASGQAIVMKILTDEARPVAELRKSVPPNVAAATAKALEKLAADRFGTAKDFAEALANPAFALATTGRSVGPARDAPDWRARLAVPLAVLAAVSTLAFAWAMRRPQPNPQVHRFAVTLAGEDVNGVLGTTLALSADGSTIVYSGPSENPFGQLWLRRSDELSGAPIPGSRAGTTPAISPNGDYLAWVQLTSVTGGPLMVAQLGGGTPRTVVDAVVPWGLDWDRDGALYYVQPEGIRRLPAGGAVEVVTVVDRDGGEVGHAWMDVLPNAKAAVFTILRAGASAIAAVRFDTGEITKLALGSFPRYSPTGHLVWALEDGTLRAAPFDPNALVLTAPAVSVLDGVRMGSRPGRADFAISKTGILLYRSGRGPTLGEPVWVDRSGAAQEIEPGWRFDPSAGTTGLALSPDGTRLAIAKREGTTDLWIKGLGAGPASRVTFEGDMNFRPFWFPDQRSIGFLSIGGGQLTAMRKPADGSGITEVISELEEGVQEVTVSQDGEWLVYRIGSAAGNRDIYAVRLDADSVVVPLATTEFGERSASLSPDGRWFAYVSNESGRDEVYVRPFPDADNGRWQVSTAGGLEPMWAHSGRELFYRNGADEMVAVAVTTEPTFGVGRQETLFSVAPYLSDFNHVLYDVGPDDQRFVMLREVRNTDNQVIWVHNWFAELKALVGNERR
ncbi:MAG: hypothetical protein BMS9Abin29_1348 [Gemmatimonadota bacterium]|nr:MAG: hypothetical protein BMS9Abin29_1348 [Gemmatimonadota bacterium]